MIFYEIINSLVSLLNVLGVNLLNLFMSKINNYKFIEFILLFWNTNNRNSVTIKLIHFVCRYGKNKYVFQYIWALVYIYIYVHVYGFCMLGISFSVYYGNRSENSLSWNLFSFCLKLYWTKMDFDEEQVMEGAQK